MSKTIGLTFKKKVNSPIDVLKGMTMEDLKAYADSQEVDISEAKSSAEIIKKIKAADKLPAIE